MINLLLLVLLLNSIYWFRRKPAALFCGLWCYSGTEPADGMKMRILALYNLKRGDHATGLCIENTVYKETINAQKFLATHPELFDFNALSKTNFTVLGHCRQATAMYSKESEVFAHPHEFLKNPEDKKAFMFMVHNGTITNVSDLCHKYELDMNVQKYSDSMQFGRILTKSWEAKNTDIFKEYEGSATVVFFPANARNTLYVHKDRMRDLFYWNDGPNKVYISSEKEGLMAIGADEVHDFKEGFLFKFTNGHITKEWDLSDKKPYIKPRVKTSYPPARVPAASRSTAADTKSKDGFYWEDHLVYYNGHAYTGDLYVEKSGRRVEKVCPSDKDNFTRYFVIQGVVAKSKEDYQEVFTRCAKGEILKPELFKKLTTSYLSQHSLYPVAGQEFPGSKRQFVWFPKLFDLVSTTDTYTWSPILSNKEFSCNRAGSILSEKSLKVETNFSELSVYESIEVLIEKKLDNEQVYNISALLFNDYVVTRRIQVQPSTYDQFVDKLVSILENYDHADKQDFEAIYSCRISEHYEVAEKGESGTNFELENLLSHALQVTMTKELEDRKEKAKKYMDFDDEDLPEDLVHADSDAEWFSSPEFKNAILFTSYENLADMMTAYGAVLDSPNIKPFLTSINRLFYDVGILRTEEWEEIDKLIKKQFNLNARTRLGSAYEALKAEQFYDELLQSFVGMEVDTEKNVSELHKSITLLEAQVKPTIEDDIRLKIYRLALSYIVERSKTLDKTKLLNTYNITTKDLEEICHN